jgi:hypothetical protein
MKMIYLITTVLIVIGLFFIFNNKLSFGKNILEQQPDSGYVKKTKATENKYYDLRGMAFTVTPDNLNLTLPDDKKVVYGTIMDWSYKGTTVTVVAFQTGDASMYLSSGAIFIGGFAHETVNKSAIELVSASQSLLPKALKAPNTDIPDKDCVKFYFLTNKGHFVHQESVADVTQPTNEWSQLFDKGQNVITQYRLITKDK